MELIDTLIYGLLTVVVVAMCKILGGENHLPGTAALF